MKLNIPELVKETVKVRREYQIIEKFTYKKTGNTFTVDFDPVANILATADGEYKVVEISPSNIMIGHDDVLTARFLTYKDGKQRFFHVLDGLPEFWEKIESLNWGRKVMFGYVVSG